MQDETDVNTLVNRDRGVTHFQSLMSRVPLAEDVIGFDNCVHRLYLVNEDACKY